MESYNIDHSNGMDKTCSINWTCHYSALDLDTPVITLAPDNNTVIEEGALNLTCNSTSSESVRYNWLLPNKTTVTSNILQINNISRTDAGNYSCTASSKVNSTTLSTSTITTINVFCKCTIDIYFYLHIISRNNIIVFHCELVILFY